MISRGVTGFMFTYKGQKKAFFWSKNDVFWRFFDVFLVSSWSFFGFFWPPVFWCFL